MTPLATALWGKVLLAVLALIVTGVLALGIVLACLYPKKGKNESKSE